MDFNYNTNENTNENKCYNINKIIYIVYFIILFVIIYFFFIFLKKENFDNTNTNNINTLQQKKLEHSQKELLKIKDKIKNKIKERDEAIYIKNNFDKINPNSFNIENDFINQYFTNQTFPSIDK